MASEAPPRPADTDTGSPGTGLRAGSVRRQMAPDRPGRLPVGVLRDLRPHRLRHRRGRDGRRRPAPIGPRRRHHLRRRLAPHHLRLGDGGHLRHLRGRRHHRRPHQPRGDARLRDLPRLPVDEGARLHHRPGARRRSPGAALVYWSYKDAIAAFEESADITRDGGAGSVGIFVTGPAAYIDNYGDAILSEIVGHGVPADLRVRGRRPDEPAAEGQPRAADHRPRRVRHRHVLRRQHRLRDQPRPRPRPADPHVRSRAGAPRRSRASRARSWPTGGCRSSRPSSARSSAPPSTSSSSLRPQGPPQARGGRVGGPRRDRGGGLLMKKLINATDAVVAEALRGFEAAHADIVRVNHDPAYIVRADAPGPGEGRRPLRGRLGTRADARRASSAWACWTRRARGRSSPPPRPTRCTRPPRPSTAARASCTSSRTTPATSSTSRWPPSSPAPTGSRSRPSSPTTTSPCRTASTPPAAAAWA